MNNPLCKYKDILGKPQSTEGMRKYRIFGIAIFDTFVVLCFAIIIARVFRLSYIYTIIGLFVIGVIVHRAFCVRTTIDIMLFGK